MVLNLKVPTEVLLSVDRCQILVVYLGRGGGDTMIDILFDHLADITPLNLLIMPSLVQQLSFFPLNPELLAVWTLLVQVSM